MKVAFLLAVVTSLAFALTEEEINDEFFNFKIKFKRNYDGDEEAVRKNIFAKNLKKIQEHNEKYAQGLVTYKLGVNNFADKKPEEIRPYTHGILHKKA